MALVLSVTELIGLELWAIKTLNGRSSADPKAPVKRQILPGNSAGYVQSWVEPRNGEVWLAMSVLPDAIQGDYYIKMQKSIFDKNRVLKNLDPNLLPKSQITPEMAGALGIAALFLKNEGRNDGEKKAIQIVGTILSAYSGMMMISRKLGEISFNPFK